MEIVAKDLVIEDKTGRALRTIRWHGEKLFVVERKDNRRLEVVSQLATLEKKKIKFSVVSEVAEGAQAASTLKSGVSLPRDCRLKLVTAPTEVISDPEKQSDKDENKRFIRLWL